MTRLDLVVAELETARASATAQFAAEVNMPVEEFLHHFRVIMEHSDSSDAKLAFRVEAIG